MDQPPPLDDASAIQAAVSSLPFYGLTILLAGQFKGYTHTAINQLLSTNGATMTNSTLTPALTHVIAPSLQGPTNSKLQAILSRRSLGEPIHLLPLQWCLDSITSASLLPIEAYELHPPLPGAEPAASAPLAPSRPSRAAAKAKRRRSSSPPPELAAMAEREDQLYEGAKAEAGLKESKPRASAAANGGGSGQASGSGAGAGGMMVQTMQPVGGVAVDYLFPHKDTTHVLQPPGEGPYDAMLDCVDLRSNKNRFFIIQILQSSLHPMLYYLYFRWGRIGEKGRQTVIDLHGAQGEDDAKRGFSRKFQDKTALPWESRHLPPVPGKYTFLDRSAPAPAPASSYASASSSSQAPAPKAGPSNSKKAKSSSKSNGNGASSNGYDPLAYDPMAFVSHNSAAPEVAPSSLPEPTQRLMQLLFSSTSLNTALSTLASSYDSTRLPLGHLSWAALEGAEAALDELDGYIAQGKARGKEVREASERYYALVPHAVGRGRLPLLTSTKEVENERALVRELSELKSTQDLITISESTAQSLALNPLDAQFVSLGLTSLDALDPSSSEFAVLSSLLSHSKGPTHMHTLQLLDAFRIASPGDVDYKGKSREVDEDEGLDEVKKLLWLGLRSSYAAGVMKEGVKVKVGEGGAMFGDGIYLHSMSTKAGTFCYHQTSAGEGLLFLVEAALGSEPYELHQPLSAAQQLCEAAGLQSVWGVGRTQPSEWIDATPLLGAEEGEGVLMSSMSYGPIEANATSSLLYDEYVVYDKERVKIRYVLRVKFEDDEPSYY